MNVTLLEKLEKLVNAEEINLTQEEVRRALGAPEKNAFFASQLSDILTDLNAGSAMCALGRLHEEGFCGLSKDMGKAYQYYKSSVECNNDYGRAF